MPVEPTQKSDAQDVVIVDDLLVPDDDDCVSIHHPDPIQGLNASTSTVQKLTDTDAPIDVDLTENDDGACDEVNIAIDLTEEVQPVVEHVQNTANALESSTIVVDSAPAIPNRKVCSQYSFT